MSVSFEVVSSALNELFLIFKTSEEMSVRSGNPSSTCPIRWHLEFRSSMKESGNKKTGRHLKSAEQKKL